MARCTAKAKSTGKQCVNGAIHGGVVCSMHGGRAPQVRRKAAERLADLIDPDRALREAARLAYSSIKDIYDEQGHIKPITEWPDDLAAAVGATDFVRRNVEGGDGHQDDVIKVKLWDKTKALDMLFKHLELYKERVELSGGITIKWEE